MDDQKTWLAGVFDRAAPTYDRIGDAYHGYFAGRLLDLIELVELPADAAMLDVACGRGAVLAAAAARGAGRLTGIDMSPAMIELARSDLRAAGIEDVELRVMDAEQLSFTDAQFDVVTAAFALFFLPHPTTAAAEFRRVLKPGGVVAVSTWGEEDERWAFEDDLLPAADAPRTRALQQPFDTAEAVTELFTTAGFTDLQVRREETEIHFASHQQWWDWHWSLSARGLLEQLSPEALTGYRDSCFAAMDALRTPAGYPLRLQALLVTGRS